MTNDHLNPHHVVRGAVLCAIIEIKINCFKPVSAGRLTCKTEIGNRGRTVANHDSRVHLDQVRVAQANGNCAILAPRKPTP